MMRRIAVVGDRLSAGGSVLTYKGPTFTFAGRQVALIGGKAWCDACQSVGSISKSGGPRRMNFIREIAANGDIVLCDCETPPRIVALLAGEAHVDDEAEKQVSKARPAPAIDTASHPHDEQARALSVDAMLQGYPYFVEAPGGETHYGRIGLDGLLPRIATGRAAEYRVHWSDEALARQAEH